MRNESRNRHRRRSQTRRGNQSFAVGQRLKSRAGSINRGISAILSGKFSPPTLQCSNPSGIVQRFLIFLQTAISGICHDAGWAKSSFVHDRSRPAVHRNGPHPARFVVGESGQLPIHLFFSFNSVEGTMPMIGRRMVPAPSPMPVAGVLEFNSAELKLKLATPMFGGGALAGQIDFAAPIRESEIRGQLRFWWRLLFRHDSRFIDPETGQFSAVLLRNRESEIFGDTEIPSPLTVKVTIDGLPLGQNNNLAAFRLKSAAPPFEFEPYSPEMYALFSAKQSEDVDRICREGLEFGLEVCWPAINELRRLRDVENSTRAKKTVPLLTQSIDDISEEIRSSLVAWVHFGGVGARTRRGLGSLELVECNEQLPPFGLPTNCSCFVGSNNNSDAMQAWHTSLDVYRRFRQSFRNGNQGRSRWPEADSIRLATNCHLARHSPATNQQSPNFPKAVLGLPIGFKFAPGQAPEGNGSVADPNRDPCESELIPVGNDRMASPIITKPIKTAQGWKSVVMILPVDKALVVNCVLRGKRSNAMWNPVAAPGTPCNLNTSIPNSQIVGTHLSGLYSGPASASPLDQSNNAIEALVHFLGRNSDGMGNPKPVFTEGL